MQFIDLKAQFAALEKEIRDGIDGVLAHGRFIMGPEVGQLEQQLADYVGVKYCIACANGTDALQLALMAYGIREGDAVFVPAFTFMSTAEVVSLVGAKPIFVDIDMSTFNMSPESLEQAVLKTLREGKYVPRAVIPVDLFGQCADYPALRPICDRYSLHLIEDGAQGFGGDIGGKRACSFGEISTTSFFPAKPLGCYGDGGAVFTDDLPLAELIRSLRIHGKGEQKYDNIRIGLNSRLDTIQAAILIPKLKAFREYELDARKHWAEGYAHRLSGCGSITLPALPEGFGSSWAQYTIMLPDEDTRGAVQKKLAENGIPSMIYYWRPLHLQAAYRSDECPEGSLPASEQACGRVLSLPMHPYMSEELLDGICGALRAAVYA